MFGILNPYSEQAYSRLQQIANERLSPEPFPQSRMICLHRSILHKEFSLSLPENSPARDLGIDQMTRSFVYSGNTEEQNGAYVFLFDAAQAIDTLLNPPTNPLQTWLLDPGDLLSTASYNYNELTREDKRIMQQGFLTLSVLNRAEFRTLVELCVPKWNLDHEYVQFVEETMYGQTGKLEQMMLKLAGIQLLHGEKGLRKSK